jgi:hypothetical protein
MRDAWLRFTVVILALLCSHAAAAQTLTLSQVEESIVAIGDTIQREYVDREAGRQVAASLREGLAEGRFPNLTTPQDVAGAMNHELQFLTHDKNLVVSVVRDRQPKKSTSNTVRTIRVNGWLEIAVPAKK